MNRQLFFQWLYDPASLDSVSLGELAELTRDYPYFQTARLLYTLNLQLLKDHRYEGELRRNSVFMADRARLKDWVSVIDGLTMLPGHEKKDSQTVHATPYRSEPDVMLENLEAQIRKRLQKIEQDQARLKELIEKRKTILGEEKPQGEEWQAERENFPFRPLPKDDLLKEFLSGRQHESREKAPFFSPEESARRSIEENDGILSETLARLVAAQGNIEKAIKIYQQLMLKNPQKSSYFAAQIEKLKKEL